MIKKITTQAFLSAMLVMSVITATHAKEPEFKSELFKKGTLVYSDDFDGGNGVRVQILTGFPGAY